MVIQESSKKSDSTGDVWTTSDRPSTGYYSKHATACNVWTKLVGGYNAEMDGAVHHLIVQDATAFRETCIAV